MSDDLCIDYLVRLQEALVKISVEGLCLGQVIDVKALRLHQFDKSNPVFFLNKFIINVANF